MGSGGLSVHSWMPEGEVRGCVVIIHGIHEHGGRYVGLAERLVERGWAVFAPDLPGHGLSGGVPGDLGRLDELLASLEGAIKEAVSDVFGNARSRNAPKRLKHLSPPLVLFGHSLGGVLSLLLAERRPERWAGIMTSGAATRPSGSPAVLIPFLWLLAHVAPMIGVRRIPSHDVAVSERARASYGEDPLVYGGAVRARSALTLWRAGKKAEAGLAAISSPLLALHGEADALASPSASRAIVDGVSSDDATLRTYDGLGHELLNEDARELVMEDIISWLEERFGPGGHEKAAERP